MDYSICAGVMLEDIGYDVFNQRTSSIFTRIVLPDIENPIV